VTQYRYWIEQVGSETDLEKSRPIIIVGTHADQLDKKSFETVSRQMQETYPVTATHNNQIYGHFALNATSGSQLTFNFLPLWFFSLESWMTLKFSFK